jgi:hypothetical protein
MRRVVGISLVASCLLMSGCASQQGARIGSGDRVDTWLNDHPLMRGCVECVQSVGTAVVAVPALLGFDVGDRDPIRQGERP